MISEYAAFARTLRTVIKSEFSKENSKSKYRRGRRQNTHKRYFGFAKICHKPMYMEVRRFIIALIQQRLLNTP